MEVLGSRILLRPTDLARSHSFYRDTLGLAVHREFGRADSPGLVFFLGNGLLEVSGSATQPPGDAVALWIQVRDVRAEHRRLADAGVTISREPRREPWGLEEMWIADPDGVRIVLVEIPEDHPLRRDLRHLVADRDRNEQGRAQQARPRDALGRPLAYGTAGVEPISEEPLPPEATLAYARSLLDDGRPFAAHEALEVRWKSCPAEERELWQGLAQLCVGLTHHARGNAVGASRLVERAAGRLEAYAGAAAPTYGLDLAALVSCARGRVQGS